MKKIKYLVMAFAAVCFTVGLTSCEKEVEKIVEKPVEVIYPARCLRLHLAAGLRRLRCYHPGLSGTVRWLRRVPELLVGHLYQPCCCR